MKDLWEEIGQSAAETLDRQIRDSFKREKHAFIYGQSPIFDRDSELRQGSFYEDSKRQTATETIYLLEAANKMRDRLAKIAETSQDSLWTSQYLNKHTHLPWTEDDSIPKEGCMQKFLGLRDALFTYAENFHVPILEEEGIREWLARLEDGCLNRPGGQNFLKMMKAVVATALSKTPGCDCDFCNDRGVWSIANPFMPGNIVPTHALTPQTTTPPKCTGCGMFAGMPCLTTCPNLGPSKYTPILTAPRILDPNRKFPVAPSSPSVAEELQAKKDAGWQGSKALPYDSDYD